jgi:hypothetical protein
MNSSSGAAQADDNISSGFAISPIIILTGMFYLNFLPRLIMAPLMVTIEKELHLGHDDSGSFFFLFPQAIVFHCFFPVLFLQEFLTGKQSSFQPVPRAWFLF